MWSYDDWKTTPPAYMEDRMTREEQCSECHGDGEICNVCEEIADNCDCEPFEPMDCESCDGTGKIEIEVDEE